MSEELYYIEDQWGGTYKDKKYVYLLKKSENLQKTTKTHRKHII